MARVVSARRPRQAFPGVRRFIGFVLLAVAIAAAGHVFAVLPPGEKTATASSEAAGRDIVRGLAVTVIDGDSLRLGQARIRLEGIDAPELGQTCRDEQGREWRCGRAAKARLAELVAGGEVACADRGYDRYGRMLAVCNAGGVRDLGRALVSEGYAVNYDRYTTRYAADQREARAARRGIWRGDFQPPEQWRADNRRETSGRSP